MSDKIKCIHCHDDGCEACGYHTEMINTEETFHEYCSNERYEFVRAINAQKWNTPLRTTAESLLIAFDQLCERVQKQERDCVYYAFLLDKITFAMKRENIHIKIVSCTCEVAQPHEAEPFCMECKKILPKPKH